MSMTTKQIEAELFSSKSSAEIVQGWADAWNREAVAEIETERVKLATAQNERMIRLGDMNRRVALLGL